MIGVEEATRLIQSHRYPVTTETVGLTNLVGRTLAESVRADRDFPPFHRVAMDGIAVNARATQPGGPLVLEGVQPAGVAPHTLSNPAHAIEVMTGAVLPVGTDTVIRYEDIRKENDRVIINLEAIIPGTHIHRQGADAHNNDVLLQAGTLLTPAEVAVLASVGKATALVYAFPSAAVIATGDELVEVHATPLPHQIRQSNVHALLAAMQQHGWKANAFHLPDTRDVIHQQLTTLVHDYDVLLLSGGVSAGKFDYIPEVLEACGIQKIFHRVNQRPGKPFWFGTSTNSRKVVFAFPGNPVSTFLCFYRYTWPWLQASFGQHAEPMYAVLAETYEFQPNLTYFLQVRVVQEQGVLNAYPHTGGGSGDFINLLGADGFLELPADRSQFTKGEVFRYIPFRSIGL